MKDEFDRIAIGTIAPTLTEYTKWVLSEAEQQEIEHLYFLARDGYQMYHIAQIIGSDIDNSYFYCSRYALRMAAYRFLDESAYDKLFVPAFVLTAANILGRVGFDENDRRHVYEEISFRKNECEVMGRAEYTKFCEKLRHSRMFKTILKTKSDAAYTDTIGYIRQQGMDQYSVIGIVDLGWTGSLQGTLRRLLESMGVSVSIHGFYMGMLGHPPETSDSKYHTWLFNEKDWITRAWFSHNLMECICCAPHGMTIGYMRNIDEIDPILAEKEISDKIPERIKKITLRYAASHKTSNDPRVKNSVMKRLKKLMLSPTIQQAKALSVYRFCDDVGEQYHRSMVGDSGYGELLREILPFKLFYTDSADGLYWYYGALAAGNVRLKIVLKYGYFYTKCLLALLRSG